MKRILVATLTLSAIIVVLNAQDPAPVPYVASVKKNPGGFGGQIRIMPGNISVNGMPVRLLIRQAFGQLQDFQVVGGPDWINSDRFDIEAKPEGGGPMGPQVLQSVFRQILEDRFALSIREVSGHRDDAPLDLGGERRARLQSNLLEHQRGDLQERNHFVPDLRAELSGGVGADLIREAISIARDVLALLRATEKALPAVDGGARIGQQHVLRAPTDDR